MKRSGSITRKTPLKASKPAPTRGAWINRTTKKRKARKALPKSNPERQAKRRKSYAVKLAAYKRSETYKAVEVRAGGMCEARFTLLGYPARCGATRIAGERLTHHHKTYARFGGKELPEDIEVLCDIHNAHAESQHPTRSRNYR